MKEERMAILSMVEKGIITVDEAERLFAAIKGGSKRAKVEEIMSKAGDKLNILAKNVNKKTEKIMKKVSVICILTVKIKDTDGRIHEQEK